MENYLKVIYLLAQQGDVRGVKIANALHLTRGAVSMALKALEDEGYLRLDERRLVHLTERGLKIGESIYDRYLTLLAFLLSLNVDQETAEQDACRLEHSVSSESCAAIKRYYTAIKQNQ